MNGMHPRFSPCSVGVANLATRSFRNNGGRCMESAAATSPWLPPGGSQGAVAGAGSIQRSALFHPQMGGCAARVANLATLTGRGGSHWLAATNALHPLSQPVRAASSPRGGAKAALPQREAKSLPYSGEPAYLWGCLAGEPLVVIPVNVKYEQKMTFFRQITPGGIC